MEDLAAAVQSILNDPQSMAQLQSVMNSLGMNPPQASAPASPSKGRSAASNRVESSSRFALAKSGAARNSIAVIGSLLFRVFC